MKMKTTGLVLSIAGGIGLATGAALEFSTGGGLSRLVNFGLIAGLLDHRMLIVLISGFALVAGAVLYGLSLTEEALGRMTAMIREAIDAPDTYPAVPMLLNNPISVPAPSSDLTASRPTGEVVKMVPDVVAREGGVRGA
jgi:HAMP domain-containing protein